jgi:hypothetical protein
MTMTQATTAKPKMPPETRRAIIKWIVQAAAGWVGYGLILFVSAGTMDWVWGWVMLIVMAIFLAAHPIILIPINPALLAEREKGLRDRGIKTWDRWIAVLAGGVFPIVSWIVAGLDFRFSWTEPLPLAVHLSGLLVMALGFALFLWAMASGSSRLPEQQQPASASRSRTSARSAQATASSGCRSAPGLAFPWAGASCAARRPRCWSAPGRHSRTSNLSRGLVFVWTSG